MTDDDGVFRSLGKARMPDMDVARKVSIDYTMAAARALKEQLDKDGKSKFRFVYLSGMAAERDQTKALWFMQEYRRIRVSLAILCRQKSAKMSTGPSGE